MIIKLVAHDYKDGVHVVDVSRPLDISIPVRFDDEQVSAFGAPPARCEIYKVGDFTGNVSQGGSCNCETYTITPHCNGTHTECIGHITKNDTHICDVIEDSFILAKVFTVIPQRAGDCGETYNEFMAGDDLVITQKSLQQLATHRAFRALVLRTLPNSDEKLTRDYSESMPPYFTREAMDYIATSKFMHVLVDFPSVDRLDDGGALINHRTFWGLDEGEVEADPSPKTITELVYVPDGVEDGAYLLNLQVAAFKADAAPSRPVLYKIEDHG